ncbi:MAG: KUP/HAK/KT family potassium transporter, partial [Ramlibacter sp.]|nr:KUP/HAK/KT family potassium transporter [Ramlibacter sp.]
IEHTSVRDTGQIYIPFVNWGLFVAIVLAVVMFRSSSNLAAAYGIAVTLDMLITTTLTFFVIRYGWKYPLALCIAATGLFFVVDLAFFSSNLLKLFQGGWFPLLIGGAIFTLMMTWKQGRELLNQKLRADAIDLKSFLEAVFVSPPARVEGSAVFLTAEPGTVPNAMLHNLKHNKVLHEHNLFVTVRSHEVPWIGLDKRLAIESLGHNCWQVVVHYGFKNDPDLPRALEQIRARGCELAPMSTSYFLSRDVVVPTIGSGMAAWREKLFAQMHHNASGAADFLNLPNNSVVELGSKIEI